MAERNGNAPGEIIDDCRGMTVGDLITELNKYDKDLTLVTTENETGERWVVDSVEATIKNRLNTEYGDRDVLILDFQW